MNIFTELKRRNVFKIAIAYAVGRKIQPLLDDPAAARAELRRLAAEMKDLSPFSRSVIGTWAAYFDDPELMLDMFREYLIKQKNARMAFLVWRSLYAGVRQLPGFKDLLREIGLVDYWRATGKWPDLCTPVGDDDFECR